MASVVAHIANFVLCMMVLMDDVSSMYFCESITIVTWFRGNRQPNSSKIAA